MLEREFHIARLVAAGIKGTLKPEEEKELNAWIGESDLNRQRYQQWQNEELLAHSIKDFYQVDSDAIYQKIDSAILKSGAAPQPIVTANTRSIWPRIAAAASILLALGVTGYWLLHRPLKESRVAGHQQQEILPGGNKAFLVLGNGQRISLTDAHNGTIATQNGMAVDKTADGSLAYHRSDAENQHTEQLYNTIETPRSGQYRVTLSDGSKVWLNAASSLKYPSVFTGAARQVELTGEAYFEITKDKTHPFLVKTARQTVEVLGTRFDINSYPDEKNIATTLIEGSVRVAGEKGQVIIAPGEQALNNGGEIRVRQANIDDAIDWHNGDFYLNRVDFRLAMRKIARWYDVEVIYDPSVPDNIESGGWISRSNPLSAVLKAMESTGQVHFTIDGRKVYVSKKK